MTRFRLFLLHVVLLFAGLACLAQAQVPLTGAGKGTASTPAFSPASLPGVVGWYTADEGVYTNVGCTTPATNSQSVNCWTNKIGGGPNLVTTSGNLPVFLTAGFNSKQTVQFTGSDGTTMQAASFAMGSGSLSSGFFAASIGAGSGTVARIVCYAAPAQNCVGANSLMWMILQSSTTVITNFQAAFLSSATIVNGTNYRFGSIFDGTNATFYLNNVAQTPAGYSATWTTAGALVVACEKDGGNCGDTNMSEIIITTSDIGTTNRNLLDTYLQAHWGL